MLFRKFVLAAAAATSLTAFASAQAQTTDPSWTGFYAGLHGGGTIDHGVIGASGDLAGNANALTSAARPSGVVLNRDGAEGGAQIGFNLQRGPFVAGVEADIAALDADASNVYQGLTPAGPQNTYLSEKINDLGTVRARLGYLITPRVLLYGTGGYAYGDVRYGATFGNPAGGVAYAGSDRYTAGGYALGGGAEYAYPAGFNMFGRHSAMTVRLEYLYYNLGRKDVNVPAIAGGGGAGGYVGSFNTEGSLLRAGVNFKY